MVACRVCATSVRWVITRFVCAMPAAVSTALVTTSWLFVIFGESQLAVSYLTNCQGCSPCSEFPLPDLYPSKVVYFDPATCAYGLVGERVTSSLKPCHQKQR
jgi:hypothetical protein